MKPTSFLLALTSVILPGILALGQNQTVTLTGGNGLLQLAGNGKNGQILLSSNDWWGVIRAAEDLAMDFARVTGKNLTLANWLSSGTPSKRDAQGFGPPMGGVGDGPGGPQGGPGGPGGYGGYGGHGGHGGYGGYENDPGAPKSGDHNKTQTQGSGTTVIYTYNPVTSFINVSLSKPHSLKI